MTSHPPPRLRRRLAAFAAAGLALAATATTLGATPAGAATAPLATTDGIGIRVDENAILGPALELIENEIQPFANQMIYNGALANSPAGTPKSLQVSSNVELGFDFVNAGTSGYPQGGLKVHADIEDIVIRYIKDPVWPFADCSIWVRPDDATIDASARIDTSKLPAAPLTLNPIDAWWDDDPSVSSDGVCWWWLIDDFFDNIFGSGSSGSIADNIEQELNGQAQDLINDLWADHVTPVINSLTSFGITFNQLRTDDHGLIVTANTNAAGGLTIPGMAGGPYNVAATESAGVTSNVNSLLAARSEVTVTIHPNVVNQYMNALNQFQGGNVGTVALPASIESFLLPASLRGLYSDNDWFMTTTVSQPYFTKPTGTGGRPQLQLPQVTFSIGHPDYGFGFFPLAVFNGTMSGINLATEVRAGSSNWGPALNPSAATVSLTLDTMSSDPDMVSHYTGTGQSTSTLLPHARATIDLFNDTLLVPYVTLAPISIGGLNVSLCTACTRFSGDQRYTEYFNVG